MRSLKNQVIAVIVIGIILPFVIGTMVLNQRISKGLITHEIDTYSTLIDEVIRRVDESFVNHIDGYVTMLAQLPTIVEANGDLTSYVNTKEGEKAVRDVESVLAKDLKVMKESIAHVNYIFLGFDNGAYMEYPEFEPTDRYDPRVRPWYMEAIATKDSVITKPYISRETKEMVVSFARSLETENGIKGVVGIAVGIDHIRKSISEISFGKNGYIMVTDAQGSILVSPKETRWLTLNKNDLPDQYKEILSLPVGIYDEVNLDGRDYYVLSQKSDLSDWRYYGLIEKKELEKFVKDISWFLYGVIILITLLVSLAVWFQMNRITGPILTLSSWIDNIAGFKLNLNKDLLKKDIRRRDEIGIITRSLDGMYRNYEQLSKELNMIQIFLSNIELGAHTGGRLSLMENNPFNPVKEAMNDMLDRMESSYDTIRYLALHDSLTKLGNRNWLVEEAGDLIRREVPFIIGLLDLNDFKAINDTLGHDVGDEVLKYVSAHLKSMPLDALRVSRFGGDEFLVLIEGDFNDMTRKLYQELQHIFYRDVTIGENDFNLSYSMGVAAYPLHSREIGELIKFADLALYKTKETKRLSYTVFEETLLIKQNRKNLITQCLRTALSNDGFNLVYQPQIDLRTGQVRGYEALLRLKDDSFYPGEFIEVAEAAGLIIPIGRWVVAQAIKQLAEWRLAGMDLKPIGINFSPEQIHDTRFYYHLVSLLKDHAIEAKYIDIEITEAIIIKDQKKAIKLLNQLRMLGVTVSVDDFGTGYSSLAYLTMLPVDVVKLDRNLCLVTLDDQVLDVMGSIISLAHALKLDVIAEGIEREDHIKKLMDAGCDMVQGYYFDRPLIPEEAYSKAEYFYPLP